MLNCHSKGIGVGIGVAGMAELSSFTGWNESDNKNNNSEEDDDDDERRQPRIYDREDLDKAVALLFGIDDCNRTNNTNSDDNDNATTTSAATTATTSSD